MATFHHFAQVDHMCRCAYVFHAERRNRVCKARAVGIASAVCSCKEEPRHKIISRSGGVHTGATAAARNEPRNLIRIDIAARFTGFDDYAFYAMRAEIPRNFCYAGLI